MIHISEFDTQQKIALNVEVGWKKDYYLGGDIFTEYIPNGYVGVNLMDILYKIINSNTRPQGIDTTWIKWRNSIITVDMYRKLLFMVCKHNSSLSTPTLPSDIDSLALMLYNNSKKYIGASPSSYGCDYLLLDNGIYLPNTQIPNDIYPIDKVRADYTNGKPGIRICRAKWGTAYSLEDYADVVEYYTRGITGEWVSDLTYNHTLSLVSGITEQNPISYFRLKDGDTITFAEIINKVITDKTRRNKYRSGQLVSILTPYGVIRITNIRGYMRNYIDSPSPEFLTPYSSVKLVLSSELRPLPHHADEVTYHLLVISLWSIECLPDNKGIDIKYLCYVDTKFGKRFALIRHPQLNAYGKYHNGFYLYYLNTSMVEILQDIFPHLHLPPSHKLELLYNVVNTES